MRVPPEELPDIEWIRQLASQNLPRHYLLRDVRCGYESHCAAILPRDLEIVIEYMNLNAPMLAGSSDEIAAHHVSADPLLEAIRAEWPPSTVRIAMIEQLPDA